MADAINELRRSILADYAESIGLPKEARYYGGARLRPVVPLRGKGKGDRHLYFGGGNR